MPEQPRAQNTFVLRPQKHETRMFMNSGNKRMEKLQT